MKKRLVDLLIGLVIGLILANGAFAFAEQPVKIIVNGREVYCDVQPQIVNDRVLVPVRFVSEALGAKVDWDGDQKKVIISSQNISQVNQTSSIATQQQSGSRNEPEMLFNYPGNYISPPIKVDGFIYLPVILGAQNYGLIVNWNNISKTIEFPQSSITVQVSNMNGTSEAFIYQGRTYIKESIINEAKIK